jgi:CMP-N-acetylneuraminic acid synthetase
MVAPKRVAVIPARGGSKRIRKKNILDFHGKPMLAWTVEAALESGLFDTVLVSTDDPEIAAAAVAAGAAVPFLRQDHADDHAPISMATLAALDQLERHQGVQYDVVVQLMANCPLRRATHIRAALDNFDASGAPSQISCFRFGWMNPWWAVKLDAAGVPSTMFADTHTARSQDLPPLFCPTGAIWVAQAHALRAAGSFYCPGHIMHPMPLAAAVDIDDHDDLHMALAMFSMPEAGQ